MVRLPRGSTYRRVTSTEKDVTEHVARDTTWTLNIFDLNIFSNFQSCLCVLILTPISLRNVPSFAFTVRLRASTFVQRSGHARRRPVRCPAQAAVPNQPPYITKLQRSVSGTLYQALPKSTPEENTATAEQTKKKSAIRSADRMGANKNSTH
ncbi:hypothetical protein FHG87_018008 [Trinorchestia longiramus]|nr:hypothetical protein FHG87_018008 [Trinorchestia longiramus]